MTAYVHRVTGQVVYLAEQPGADWQEVRVRSSVEEWFGISPGGDPVGAHRDADELPGLPADRAEAEPPS